MKSMLGNILGFGRTHETKYLFLLLKREIDLKVLDIFFWNILKKTRYFNIAFVFYNINIKPDIMQNWLKNIWENHNFLKGFYEKKNWKFLVFLYYYFIYNIIYTYILINLLLLKHVG